MFRIAKALFVTLGAIGTLTAPFAAFFSPRPLEIFPILPDVWIGAILIGALVLSASGAAWWLGLAFLPTSVFLGFALFRIATTSVPSQDLGREQLALLASAALLLGVSAVVGVVSVRGFRSTRAAV